LSGGCCRRSEQSALGNLGLIYTSEEKYSLAIEHYKQALRLASAIEDPRTEALCLMNIGTTAYRMASYQEAIGILDQALQIFTEIADKYNKAIILGDFRQLLRRFGRFRSGF